MKWKVTLILLCVLGYLQYSLWLGRNNLHDYWQVQKVIADMKQQNHELKMRNEQMFAETNDLHDGLEAIEERARTNLGMIKSSEHFYRVIEESESH